jgi:hypothetical protein
MKKVYYLIMLATMLMGLVPGCGDADNDPSQIIAEQHKEQNIPESEVATDELAEARFLIEHNAADEDTGFQLFIDGEPWNSLVVEGPNGTVVNIKAQGDLENFGLTEGFFETNEPPDSEFPLDQILALFPEGEYSFEANTAEGNLVMRRSATLSHVIPAAAEILTPGEEETIAAENVEITWRAVTQALNGGAVNIVGYQVIVVEDVESGPSQSFFKNELSVFVPASQNSLTVPNEFIQSGKDYEIEVLAIEESGNQTIAIRAFSTAAQRPSGMRENL